MTITITANIIIIKIRKQYNENNNDNDNNNKYNNNFYDNYYNNKYFILNSVICLQQLRYK